jgi:hypothetical protein
MSVQVEERHFLIKREKDNDIGFRGTLFHG